MRIDGFQNIPAVLQSFKADTSLKSTSDNENAPSSSLSFSSFAEVLQSLQREAVQSAKVRSQRVDQLAQQAQSGKLPVDVAKIAKSMVDLQVID